MKRSNKTKHRKFTIFDIKDLNQKEKENDDEDEEMMQMKQPQNKRNIHIGKKRGFDDVDNDGYNNNHHPNKRQKVSSLSSPIKSNPFNTNYNINNNDDDHITTKIKKRGFQQHDKKFVENGLKHRQQIGLNKRRKERNESLLNKHKNFMKQKQKNQHIQNNKFDFNFTPNTNQNPYGFNNDYRSSMSSDETMNDSDDENMTQYQSHSHSYSQHMNMNMNNMNNTHLHFGSGRHSFIPQTCPLRSKYSKRTRNRNEPQHDNDNGDGDDNDNDKASTQPPFMNDNNNHNHSNKEMYDDINMKTPSPPTQTTMQPKQAQTAFIRPRPSQPTQPPHPPHPPSSSLSPSIEKKKEKRQQINKEKAAKRAAERIEELNKEKINQKKQENEKSRLREMIHPQIINKARKYIQHGRKNPVGLIKLFYPKSRIKNDDNLSVKDIIKGFKRALANFHPDRTMNKSLAQKIEYEEIFKLLSAEKEYFEQKINKKYSATPQPQMYRSKRNNNFNSYSSTNFGWF